MLLRKKRQNTKKNDLRSQSSLFHFRSKYFLKFASRFSIRMICSMDETDGCFNPSHTLDKNAITPGLKREPIVTTCWEHCSAMIRATECNCSAAIFMGRAATVMILALEGAQEKSIALLNFTEFFGHRLT